MADSATRTRARPDPLAAILPEAARRGLDPDIRAWLEALLGRGQAAGDASTHQRGKG